MSFKLTIAVPRITASKIAELEALVPGLSKVVTIPVIDRLRDIRNTAKDLAERQIEREEYVRDVEAVEEISTGWLVTLNIAGD